MAEPCARCASSNVLELQMTAKNGQTLTMSNCTRCETRTWTADGSVVTREEVLRITSGDDDFVVLPSPTKARRGQSR